ncbi:MAG: MotA/TolQ/ExbB proton channel family protein [Gammaproteobacteria bacterium]
MRIALVFSATLLLIAGAAALAQETLSLDSLLETVKTGRAQDAKENAARLAAFKANKAEQQNLLGQAQAARSAGEARSKELEAEFEANDLRVVELDAALKERLGSLKELFGVLQQAAGDARGQFEASLTQVQYPERSEFLTQLAQKMGQTSKLASLEEIEQLWFELQREMTESGKVVRFKAPVVTADGSEVEQDVIRVGAFNVVANGKYLQFVPETGRLLELGRQPQQRYLDRVAQLESANDGTAAFALDPSRGQILSLLVQAPSLRERIDQGGVVGYVIIGLGVLALLIALERLVTLTLTSTRVRMQARKLDQPGNNPLGRVLKVYHDNPAADVETLELKLSEAILRETPKINRLLMFLKIIAVVAPLLGLLGTVTGMIITFQAITLFGTGDPKLMAGGISQALVTTVLGLCVAIPTVLMHTLVTSRARRLNQVLEEQTAGMIAVQSEARHSADG